MATDLIDEKAPPPVPQIVHDLLALGSITGILVDYRQTGVDSADTYWILTGCSQGYGKPAPVGQFLQRDVQEYLQITPQHHAFLASVKSKWANAYALRRQYEKRHAKDLAEYERLKRKFEESGQ